MADYIFDDEQPNQLGFDGIWHTFAMVADLAEDGTLEGGRAWFPAATPDNFVWAVFDSSDQSIVAQVNLAALENPTPNAWNEFTSAVFQTPGDVALSAGEYRPAVATNGDFVFSTSPEFPIEHNEVITVALAAFHNGDTGPQWPEELTTSFLFFADMLVSTALPPPPDDDNAAPGAHTAGGTSATLASAGASATLTASGGNSTLTASGTP